MKPFAIAGFSPSPLERGWVRQNNIDFLKHKEYVGYYNIQTRELFMG